MVARYRLEIEACAAVVSDPSHTIGKPCTGVILAVVSTFAESDEVSLNIWGWVNNS